MIAESVVLNTAMFFLTTTIITVNFLLSRRMITYVTVIWQLQECFAVRCSARDHSIDVAVNPTLWTYDQGLVLLFVSINVSV